MPKYKYQKDVGSNVYITDDKWTFTFTKGLINQKQNYEIQCLMIKDITILFT